MHVYTPVIPLLILLVVITKCQGKESTDLKCWECNVWKAGFGHLCDNPREVGDCTVCMKVETTIFMGYYKNSPRTSTIITRACGKDYTPQFGSECLTYKMVDGWSKRCFCETDMCNGVTSHTRHGAFAGVFLTCLHVLYRILL